MDFPGALHHVINRGMARRPLFEQRSEARYFMGQLAKQVRAGRIEVVAYSLMATHFHLFLGSPRGELSEAMRVATGTYTRWFNRRHGRDGPLFRGRFFSRPVRTIGYRRVLLRYIDTNAVAAGIVRHPCDYALGSAYRYARPRPGAWLGSEWIREHVDRCVPGPAPWWDKYRHLAGWPLATGVRGLVEARKMHSGCDVDLIDELAEAAPSELLRWMQRRAAVADGGRLLMPVAGVDAVLAAVEASRGAVDHLERDWRWRRPSPGQLLRAALLRHLAGSSLEQIGRLLGVSEATARRWLGLHAGLVGEGAGAYVAAAKVVATRATRDPTCSSRGA